MPTTHASVPAKEASEPGEPDHGEGLAKVFRAIEDEATPNEKFAKSNGPDLGDKVRDS